MIVHDQLTFLSFDKTMYITINKFNRIIEYRNTQYYVKYNILLLFFKHNFLYDL